jgi:hypothetical protein
MDRAVLAANGWSDLEVPPYTTPQTAEEEQALETFQDEVIDRLFVLNAERAEEERLAGASTTKGKSRATSAASITLSITTGTASEERARLEDAAAVEAALGKLPAACRTADGQRFSRGESSLPPNCGARATILPR